MVCLRLLQKLIAKWLTTYLSLNNCLLLRVSKKEALAKLTFGDDGFPLLEVALKELDGAESSECFTLLKRSPSVFVQFHSDKICPGATSCLWKCNKIIAEEVLLIYLLPSFPTLPRLDCNDGHYSITFEFSEDFKHLAKCHDAIKCFERLKLDYLLFPSNQTYYPRTESFTFKSKLKELSRKLNSEQVSAMEAILLSKSVLPVIIAGPFGTGKTFLLSQAAEYLVKHSKTYHILICTLTNSAANVYLEHFHVAIPSHDGHKILRLLYKKRNFTPPGHLQKYFLYDSSINAFHYPTESDAKDYHIIVTTLGLAQELLKLKLTNHFTHIFIDEAAQMTVPEVMMALSLASNTTKVVMAGDHMQVS